MIFKKNKQKKTKKKTRKQENKKTRKQEKCLIKIQGR